MVTRNQVDTTLSGQTGTGSFAGSNSPTFTTPTLGVAGASSITFSTTSGIIGTSTNNNAAAGSVGQVISASVLVASAVALTNATPADVTSISLTAGDWDVWGNIGWTGNVATNVTSLTGWVSSTSATAPDGSLIVGPSYGAAGLLIFATNQVSFGITSQRFSLSGTTTVYLSTTANFTLNTCSAFGFIVARRRR